MAVSDSPSRGRGSGHSPRSDGPSTYQPSLNSPFGPPDGGPDGPPEELTAREEELRLYWIAKGHRSLCLFRGENVFRVICIRVVTSSLFENIVLLIIFINSIVILLEMAELPQPWPRVFSAFNVFVTVVFTLEFVLKSVALGFILHQASYLRNPSNVLDFLVVTTSLLESLFTTGQAASVLRTARVLRPLRSISAIPELRVIAAALVQSARGLVGVLLLSVFVFTLFGIIGVQLWMGQTQATCESPQLLEEREFCSMEPNWFNHKCEVGQCVWAPNPGYGYMSFDNIGAAFLVIFQLIALDGWPAIMYSYMDTWGWPACIYFVVVVLIGNIVVLNLALAVINHFFTINKARVNKANRRRKEWKLARDKYLKRSNMLNVPRSIPNTSDDGRRRSERSESNSRSHSEHSAAKLPREISSTYSVAIPVPEEPVKSETNSVGSAGQIGTEAYGPVTIKELPIVYPSLPVLPEGDLTQDDSPLDRDTNSVPSNLMGANKYEVESAKSSKGRKSRDMLRLSMGDSEDPDRKTVASRDRIVISIAGSEDPDPDLANNIHERARTMGFSIEPHSIEPTQIDGGQQVESGNANEDEDANSDKNPDANHRESPGRSPKKETAGLLNVRRRSSSILSKTSLQRLAELLPIPNIITAEDDTKDPVQLGQQPINVPLVLADTPNSNDVAQIPLKPFDKSVLQLNALGSMNSTLDETSPETGDTMLAKSKKVSQCHLNSFDLKSPPAAWDELADSPHALSAHTAYLKQTRQIGGAAQTHFFHIQMSKLRRSLKKIEKWARPKFLFVVNSRIFTNIILLLICINTLILMVEHFDQPDYLTQVIDKSNTILTFVFLIEMVLYLAAYGLSNWVRDPFLVLDGIIVVISVAELFLSGDSSVSVFRSLRLLRILKMVKSLPALRTVSSVILKAVSETGYLNLLIALVVYVWSVIGMELFKDKFKDPVPLATYDTVYWSFVTTFACLTRDDWWMVMWDGMRSTHPISCLYFISLLIIADFLLLSLFLAIIIQGFNAHNAEAQRNKTAMSIFSPSPSLEMLAAPMKTFNNNYRLGVLKQAFPDVNFAPVGGVSHILAHAALWKRKIYAFNRTNGGKSFFIFGEESKIRLWCLCIVEHIVFEQVVLGCIVVSSAAIAIQNPRVCPQSSTHFMCEILDFVNIAVCIFFTFEVLLKMIAYNCISQKDVDKTNPKPVFLRNCWNVLDFLVVILSTLALLPVFKEYSYVRSIRSLRAVRPMRMIKYFSGLRVVVLALIESIPGMVHVSLISSMLFVMFGILGVQIFGGKLYWCNDQTITLREECTGYFIYNDPFLRQPVNTTREWVQKYYQHYDNSMASTMTVFEIASRSMWVQIMYHSIEGTSYNVAPVRHARPAGCLYFIAIMLACAFFTMSLFAGLVNYNFTQIQARKNRFLTPAQKQWVEMQKIIVNFRPMKRSAVPTNPIRRQVYNLVKHPIFETIITTVIVLSVVAVGCEHYQMAEWLVNASDYASIVFTFLFTLEAALKITGLGVAGYFRVGWNQFDISLVVLGLLDVTVLVFFKGSDGGFFLIARILRKLRVARIVRLLQTWKQIFVLLETFWYILPSVNNIGLFLVFIYFVYALLGLNLWAFTVRGEALNRNANFESFPIAMLTLFRVSTGADWNALMHECRENPVYCTDEFDEQCETPEFLKILTPLYYVSFMMIAANIIFNLFMAAVLEQFKVTVAMQSNAVQLTDLQKFKEAWADFNPSGEKIMPTGEIIKLLKTLGQPLGVSEHCTRYELLAKTRNYQIKEHAGVIHFIEVLVALARHANFNTAVPMNLEFDEDVWPIFFPDLHTLPQTMFQGRPVTVDLYLASTYLVAAYRGSRVKKAYLKEHAQRAELNRDRVYPEAYNVDVISPRKTVGQSIASLFKIPGSPSSSKVNLQSPKSSASTTPQYVKKEAQSPTSGISKSSKKKSFAKSPSGVTRTSHSNTPDSVRSPAHITASTHKEPVVPSASTTPLADAPGSTALTISLEVPQSSAPEPSLPSPGATSATLASSSSAPPASSASSTRKKRAPPNAKAVDDLPVQRTSKQPKSPTTTLGKRPAKSRPKSLKPCANK